MSSTHTKRCRRDRSRHYQKKVTNTEDPTIATNMTTDGSTSTFNTRKTTESSNGRKIRQVLQKKQLDVLLHTFSNVLEDNEDTQNAEIDRWTIARKSSIEGNTFSRDQMSSRWEMSIDETDDEERAPNSSISRMRTNKSLVSESDIDTEYDNDYDYVGDYEFSEEREQNEIMFSSRAGIMTSDASNVAHKAIKKPKSQSNSKRSPKERVDFSTRLSQAGEVLKEFTAKTTQKHKEIAEDFQEASLKLRKHLKSGADILFEDLSEHFDEVVQKLFVDGNDQRDDERNSNGQHSSQSSRENRGAHNGGEPSGGESEERFLTHEETLRAMNQQVVDLLEPVEKTVQTYSKEIVKCVSPFEEDEYMTPISKEMVSRNSRALQQQRHLSSN